VHRYKARLATSRFFDRPKRRPAREAFYVRRERQRMENIVEEILATHPAFDAGEVTRRLAEEHGIIQSRWAT
jgi:hypothetical protein